LEEVTASRAEVSLRLPASVFALELSGQSFPTIRKQKAYFKVDIFFLFLSAKRGMMPVQFIKFFWRGKGGGL
jgi:hypothetical protein